MQIGDAEKKDAAALVNRSSIPINPKDPFQRELLTAEKGISASNDFHEEPLVPVRVEIDAGEKIADEETSDEEGSSLEPLKKVDSALDDRDDSTVESLLESSVLVENHGEMEGTENPTSDATTHLKKSKPTRATTTTTTTTAPTTTVPPSVASTSATSFLQIDTDVFNFGGMGEIIFRNEDADSDDYYDDNPELLDSLSNNNNYLDNDVLEATVVEDVDFARRIRENRVSHRKKTSEKNMSDGQHAT